MDICYKFADFQPEAAWEPSQGDVSMYQGPDLPSDDVPEELTAPEPTLIPIEISILPLIPGYEDAGSSLFIPPPPIRNVSPMENFVTSEEKILGENQVTEEEAKNVLKDLASKYFCGKNSVAKEMVLQKINSSSAYYYSLETYIETRTMNWEQEPYTGQLVDSPANGPGVPPWLVQCHPHQLFHDEIHLMEAPHSALVMACIGCRCHGFLRCHNCLGRGFKRCIMCHGSGRVWKNDPRGPRHMDSCWRCRGTGRKRCPSCGADGRVTCKTCQGFKYLKCFINIKIEFSNNMGDHIINRTGLPEDLLKTVEGYQIFQQTQPRVWPIVNHHEGELSRCSEVILSQHLTLFPSYARILMQRQRLLALPITECIFSLGEEEFRFWICGRNRQVHSPEIPRKYCCSCVVA